MKVKFTFLTIISSIIFIELADSQNNSENITPLENILENRGIQQKPNNNKQYVRSCTRRDIAHGKWIPVTLDAPPYNPYLTSHKSWRLAGMACGRESDYNSTWETYKWVPHNTNSMSRNRCTFREWSKAEFCKISERIKSLDKPKKNITIAIVGDSLSWEHYMSLSFSLGLDCNVDGSVISREKDRNYVLKACNGDSMRIGFRRTDDLAAIPDVVRTLDPSVMVINKGAHLKPEWLFIKSLDKTIRAIESWQESCRARSKFCWLFVRTTVPGHPKCHEFTEPHNNVTAMEEYIANRSNYIEKELKYGWFNLKRYNEIMLKAFRYSRVNYDVIDGYQINIRRPDNHRDCLHSCIPSGKQDVYNQIMVHILNNRLDKFELAQSISEI